MIYRPAHASAPYTEIKQFPKNPCTEDLKKEWYIYFHFLHLGRWVPVRRKSDINQVRTFKEKLRELHALKKSMQDLLQKGWNPITKKFNEPASLAVTGLDENMSMIRALDFAFEKCEVAESTKKNYRNCLKKIKASVKLLFLEQMKITETKRKHFRLILEHARAQNKWSNNAFNKNLGYLQGILSRLEDWEVIEYNPAHKIKPLPVYELEKKFVPYTTDEKKRIAEYLFLHHYGYYVYVMTIYHTGLRPMEVLALKIKDLLFDKSIIRIIPEKQRQNSKTKRLREVQLNPHLLPLLREWVKGMADRDLFVFGSPYAPGKGNKGSSKGRTGDGAFHPDYFKPSMTRIKRDTVTRLWKKIVIEKLKIEKYLYAGKHTGTDDRLEAGISIEALRDMYGHSTTYMTERYQTKLKEMRREEINQKSPSFI